MNPFEIERGESFTMGESDLRELLDSPYKIRCGLILFCRSGMADVSVDLVRCTLKPNTVTVLLPDTILTLNSSGEYFKVEYIVLSANLFDEAVFRLEPPFFRFILDNPCLVCPPDDRDALDAMIRMFWIIYKDRGNMYRDVIIKNQSQNFFLNMYDKNRHLFSSLQRNGYNRGEELFHKFITCIQTHYLDQKDVAFYANELCISPRYLSTITRQVTGESAKTLIDRHIILETKVLLRTTEMTVQEITNRLNFPSQSYLGRYFKKHTGESPIEYRMKRK
ncbi:helix-turn-helix domain-containing protein [Parabacteroides sp.]